MCTASSDSDEASIPRGLRLGTLPVNTLELLQGDPCIRHLYGPVFQAPPMDTGLLTPLSCFDSGLTPSTSVVASQTTDSALLTRLKELCVTFIEITMPMPYLTLFS
jgi:hypothetical protein